MAEAPSTSEADRVPQVDDSEMYWHEATSKDGKKYRIGVHKSDYPGLSEQEIKDAFATQQGLPEKSVDNIAGLGVSSKLGNIIMKVTHTEDSIYWPYTGNDDSWKKPAQRIKDRLDITRYRLNKNFFGICDHELSVDITEAWNYDFYDESKDSYRIYCFRTGVHTVAFDSKKPTIEKIVAWS